MILLILLNLLITGTNAKKGRREISPCALSVRNFAANVATSSREIYPVVFVNVHVLVAPVRSIDEPLALSILPVNVAEPIRVFV